jgi:hypothetical protein
LGSVIAYPYTIGARIEPEAGEQNENPQRANTSKETEHIPIAGTFCATA